jgi:hypothetical protein
MVWLPRLDRFSDRRYCTDSVDRFRKDPKVIFFAAAAADSRRLTRTLAQSALPTAPIRRERA